MKHLFTLTLLLLSIVLSAQETQEETPIKKFSFEGSVDAYYQTYLTASDNDAPTFGTAFAGKSGFALGMANVILSYEGEKEMTGWPQLTANHAQFS